MAKLWEDEGVEDIEEIDDAEEQDGEGESRAERRRNRPNRLMEQTRQELTAERERRAALEEKLRQQDERLRALSEQMEAKSAARSEEDEDVAYAKQFEEIQDRRQRLAEAHATATTAGDHEAARKAYQDLKKAEREQTELAAERVARKAISRGPAEDPVEKARLQGRAEARLAVWERDVKDILEDDKMREELAARASAVGGMRAVAAHARGQDWMDRVTREIREKHGRPGGSAQDATAKMRATASAPNQGGAGGGSASPSTPLSDAEKQLAAALFDGEGMTEKQREAAFRKRVLSKKS